MFYDAEFAFLKNLLKNLYINFTVIEAPASGIPHTLPDRKSVV